LFGGIGTRVNWGEEARYPYLKRLQTNQTTELFWVSTKVVIANLFEFLRRLVSKGALDIS
jgi:hypothetical protein